MGAHFEALDEGVLLVPLDPRYTQIGFNLISVQVCYSITQLVTLSFVDPLFARNFFQAQYRQDVSTFNSCMSLQASKTLYTVEDYTGSISAVHWTDGDKASGSDETINEGDEVSEQNPFKSL